MLLTLVCVVALTVGSFAANEELEKESEKKRLASLEERISRLEKTVERLARLVETRLEHELLTDAATQLEQVDPPSAEAQVDETATTQDAPDQSEQQQPVQAQVLDSPGPGVEQEIVNLPYSGYMEMHVNNDGINPTTLDFHRFVLLFGHGFGERIRFWSEVELEHAFVEGGERTGEIELEQAYLDFLIHPKINLRTGMVLTPVGIINERHEPPSFHGVERPFVDSFLVPTTWFGGGVGLLGDLGMGLRYKTYLMSSLNSAEFSAEEGFAGGPQKGFLENLRNTAWVGRLEWNGIPGLDLGTSFWTGETGFSFRDINGRARIVEFDGRYRFDRFEGRGQFVETHLDDAGAINLALRRQSGINPNLAEKMRGFYLEGAVNLFPNQWTHALFPFYRYENFDTQFEMPAGYVPLKQFDRSAHIIGLTYFPYPDVSFKFDHNLIRNQSFVIKPPNRWNFGVGWWF